MARVVVALWEGSPGVVALLQLAGVARQLRLGYGCRVLWQHSAENGYQLLGTDALKDMVLEVKMLTSSADWVPSTVVAPSPHMPGGELPGKLNITARRGDVLMKRDTGIEGVTEWYLSNGMTVVTCAGAANSDDVRVRCVAPGGISELSGSAVKAAALSCFAMELAGLGDLSADELEEALQGHVRACGCCGGTTACHMCVCVCALVSARPSPSGCRSTHRRGVWMATAAAPTWTCFLHCCTCLSKRSR